MYHMKGIVHVSKDNFWSDGQEYSTSKNFPRYMSYQPPSLGFTQMRIWDLRPELTQFPLHTMSVFFKVQRPNREFSFE